MHPKLLENGSDSFPSPTRGNFQGGATLAGRLLYRRSAENFGAELPSGAVHLPTRAALHLTVPGWRGCVVLRLDGNQDEFDVHRLADKRVSRAFVLRSHHDETPSAGQQLQADMDAALARAARDLGQPLEFSEIERHTLARAAARNG